jgi:hypothetical protein
MPVVIVDIINFDAFVNYYKRTMVLDVISKKEYKFEFIGIDKEYYSVELKNSKLLENVIESKHFDNLSVDTTLIVKIAKQISYRNIVYNSAMVYSILLFVSCVYDETDIKGGEIFMEQLINIAIDWYSFLPVNKIVVFDDINKKQIDITSKYELADVLTHMFPFDEQNLGIIESILY